MDIPHSLAAAGRGFKLPLNLDLTCLPALNTPNNTALFQYFCNMSKNSIFAQSVLQILVEKRHTYNRNQRNTTIPAPKFCVGDVVKAHIPQK